MSIVWTDITPDQVSSTTGDSARTTPGFVESISSHYVTKLGRLLPEGLTGSCCETQRDMTVVVMLVDNIITH